MHPYIPHLLFDIAAACQDELREDFYVDDIDEEQMIEKYMDEIDIYIAGEEPSRNFGYYCGLQPQDFPPPEQLDNDDLEEVCNAFREMMDTWNLLIDFPDNLPLPIAYSLTVGMLNTKTNIPKYGVLVFDFCTGYAPDCALKSFCRCLKIENEDKENTLSDLDIVDDNSEENDDLDEDKLLF